jgi:hypothetical protein
MHCEVLQKHMKLCLSDQQVENKPSGNLSLASIMHNPFIKVHEKVAYAFEL